jgi:hypothetical protein
MFAILKQLDAIAVETVVPKRSLLQKLMGVYKGYKAKRAFTALKLAKRAEKAAVVKSNTDLAAELEARSDALVLQSVQCKRTNKVESDRLLDEAITLATEASALRFS